MRGVEDWPHLKNINIVGLADKRVTILIGGDVPEALCSLN